MNEVTYSWSQYLKITKQIFTRLISKIKKKMAGVKQDESVQTSELSSKRSSMEPVDIEITSEFFSAKFLPLMHQTVMSNVKVGSKGILNLIISLRTALMHEVVTMEEHNLILNLLIQLPEFWKWRNATHSFIDSEKKFEINDKGVLLMKKQFSTVYTDKTRILFDDIRHRINLEPLSYKNLSIYIRNELKEKMGLNPVEMLIYGFLCPDHEFQAQLTQFMYSQINSIFTFSEDSPQLKSFLKLADWIDPICIFSDSDINVVNLITSIAKHYGISLNIMRQDPVILACLAVEQLENYKTKNLINSQIIDLTKVQTNEKYDMDQKRLQNMANNVIIEPELN